METQQPVLEITNQNQALQILINAVRIAQSKGAFTLEEAEVLAKAIKMFAVPPRPQDAPQDAPIVS